MSIKKLSIKKIKEVKGGAKDITCSTGWGGCLR
jgi:hypothetical protein